MSDPQRKTRAVQQCEAHFCQQKNKIKIKQDCEKVGTEAQAAVSARLGRRRSIVQHQPTFNGSECPSTLSLCHSLCTLVQAALDRLIESIELMEAVKQQGNKAPLCRLRTLLCSMV